MAALLLAAGFYSFNRSSNQTDVFRIDYVSARIARLAHTGEIPFLEDILRPKPILLTFDDSPEDTATDHEILAILKEHHARAIWFINCKNLDPAINEDAASHRTVLKEIVSQGNVLGNHGYNHLDLAVIDKTNPMLLGHEIGDCSNMIKSISGIQPNYFRPPFGVYTPHVKSVIEHDGMHLVHWSSNSFDSMLHAFKIKPQLYIWYLKHNPAFNIVGNANAGDILLMHDYPNTAYALDGILTGLEKRGFVFVIPEQP